MSGRRKSYVLTVPERLVRSAFAAGFGSAHEAAQLVLPRFVRRSKLYEVTAKNALRIAIELVGGVETVRSAAPSDDSDPDARRLAVRKAAGNAVELGSIAALGFSPLWLLAGAADLIGGSRAYLRALERELVAAGILRPDRTFGSVDELLGALEGLTSTTAGVIDLPPVEIRELRRSLTELRTDVSSLPSGDDLAGLFRGMSRIADLQGRSLLEVSSAIGLALAQSGRNLSRTHLLAPYREDWAPVREEGFAAYTARVARPYRKAIEGQFHPDRRTFTQRGGRLAGSAAARLGRFLRSRR